LIRDDRARAARPEAEFAEAFDPCNAQVEAYWKWIGDREQRARSISISREILHHVVIIDVDVEPSEEFLAVTTCYAKDIESGELISFKMSGAEVGGESYLTCNQPTPCQAGREYYSAISAENGELWSREKLLDLSVLRSVQCSLEGGGE
jgi:hypothetical protein